MPIEDIYKGTTKVCKFTFTDELGAAIDITGWQIILMVKRYEKDLDSSAVINKTATVGDDPLDVAGSGLMHITIDSADSDVTPGQLYYELRRVIPGSPPDEKVLDAGTFGILYSIYNIT
jgi:hypothetical protein